MRKESSGCEFLSGVMCAEEMGCGRKWVIWVILGAGTVSWRQEMLLKDFTDDELTTLAGSSLQNGTARTLKAFLRGGVDKRRSLISSQSGHLAPTESSFY